MSRLTCEHRAVLAAALSLPLLLGTACGTESLVAQSDTSEVGDGPVTLAELERHYDASIGLFAIDTATGRSVTHRADQRFPLLSTFKTLVTAALLRAHPIGTGYFDRVVHFTAADLVEFSPVTGTKVTEGMTVAQLADAAITLSDNTAGNLLLRELGGPRALTEFLRSIGDQVTRLDRWETDLNSAVPGDERDTTTPAALAAAYRAVVLGDVLGPPERAQLTTWLKANTTGDKRIRAGLPAGWSTGDRTGTGAYGCANDAAVTWPSGGRAPLVIVVQSCRSGRDATADNAMFPAVTQFAVQALR